MQRLFIIGASILQLPAIRKAKELGLYVGVADYNPSAIGISYADEYFNVSTIDEQGIYEAAKAFRADGIMTLATDMPMRSVAYACEKLGLVGISYDTAIKSTDKGEMIKAFEAAAVEHPWYVVVSGSEPDQTLLETITFPCITKPTDNSGSRGIMLVNNRDELDAALAYSAENGRCGAVIIEEYMRGDEVSVEMMVINGVPHILQITDKLTTGAPHFVEMGHSQPSRLSIKQQEAIRDLACRSVAAVGLDNGPAHVEIMLTENGPKMVELGARMGGDCITTHLVPLSTGVDMIRATIDCCLGNTPDLTPALQCGSAIRFLDVPCGIIRTIDGAEQAKAIHGVCDVSFSKNIGESVGAIGSSTDRVGFVIAQGTTAANAVNICENAIKTIVIHTERQK